MSPKNKTTISALVDSVGKGSGDTQKAELPTVAQLSEMRARCLSCAELHIADAELLLANGRLNGAYILASLGIEEIGKAEMQFMKVDIGVPLIEEQAQAVEDGETDHREKLSVALFFAHIAKDEMPRPEHIREARRLADSIYAQRLALAYSPGIGEQDGPVAAVEDVEPLVQLARARLEMARATGIGEPDARRREEVLWFFNNLHDRAFRHFIQTNEPAAQRAPNDPDWLTTLRQSWHEQSMQNLESLREELARNPPQGVDGERRRWQITVRFESEWHRFRAKTFAKWNERDVPFSFEANRKDDRQLIVHLRLQEMIPLQAVWPMGHDMAKLLLLALNMGSMGVLWWRVSRFKNKFCEGVVDLDKGAMVVVERNDPGALEWGGERTFSEENLEHAAMCIGLLAHLDTKRRNALIQNYDLGTGALAMHDMHGNFAPGAFDYFVRAYAVALHEFRGWNEKSILSPLRDFYSKIGDADERDGLLLHVQDLEQHARIQADIGIKFGFLMKIATDAIIIVAARDELQRRARDAAN